MIAPRFGYPLVIDPPRTAAEPAGEGLRGSARAALDRWLLLPAVRRLLKPFTVHGRAHVESFDGPAVFAANHSSHLDALVVLAALPEERRRSLRIAAAEDYFYTQRLRRTVVSAALPTYPFKRDGDSGRSLDDTDALLANGRSMLIFPEGTRSTDGEIARFRRGVALIAARAGVPVIPVYLDGAHDALPKGALLPQRRAVSVSFGAPLEAHDNCCGAAFADAIRDEVLALREVRRRRA